MNREPPSEAAAYLRYCLRYLSPRSEKEESEEKRPKPARVAEALHDVLPAEQAISDVIVFVRKWMNTPGWRPQARPRRLESASELDVVLVEGGMGSHYLESGIKTACQAGPRSLGIVSDRRYFPVEELKLFREHYVSWVLVTDDISDQWHNMRRHCPETRFHTFGTPPRLRIAA